MTRKIIRVEQQDREIFNLTWIINNICTNACSYCPSNLHNGTNHNYEWENAKKFFNLLFERYPYIHCNVAGGEPSVSPFFPELVKIFRENNSTIGLTSNAAKPATWWKNIAADLQYVALSWHSEFIDPDFYEKALTCSKLTPTTVRIIMHPRYWNQCVEQYEFYKKQRDIFYEPVRIQNWGGDSDPDASQYTEEQLKWFENNLRSDFFINFKEKYKNRKDYNWVSHYYMDDGTVEKGNTNNWVSAGMTNFNGYTCAIGTRSLFIDPRGDIYKGNCMVGGRIGNINAPEFIKWPVNPTLCNINSCTCSTDVELDKWI